MIGDDIKKYLNNNGIKQSIISEKTGISEPKLSMMLNGKRRIEVTEYFRICDSLGVPLDTFKSPCISDEGKTKNC